MSANDIREIENMNPIEGGDVYLIPLNMVPADATADGRPPTAEEEQGGGGQRSRGKRRVTSDG
jgi:hypothetical protein